MRALHGVVAIALTVCATVPLGAQAHAHDHTSPYADFTGRDIKALSPEEVQGLLDGEGLGMALPGELNGYPGPRHILDMAPMLGLSPDQEAAVRWIFEEMQERARALGEQIVDLERELDQAFAQGSITEDQLRELVEAVGQARAELRVVHLRAHLRLRPMLTESQLEQYRKARGYGG